MIPENRNSGLVFLALVVVASGCAHTASTKGEAPSTQAVRVVNFTAVPDSIFSNQQTTLRMTVRNTGDADATRVAAKIYNVPIGEPENRKWGIENPVFRFGELRKSNEESGTPAVPAERTKTVTPPQLGANEKIPYDFRARLAFRYSTTATTEIQLMSQNRFRESSVSRSSPEVENSDGPIQIDIRTRTPIVFYEGGKTSSGLCVIVRNEGEGTPFFGNIENTNKVAINLKSSGSVEFVPRQGSEGSIDIVGNRGIKCYDFENFNFDPSRNIQRTIPITLEARYGYYKDAQTSVTVKGRR